MLSPNWLGDAAMALPAIADVRRHFSEATLALAARSGLAPLFESVPGVDVVVRLESSGKARARWRADAQALRAQQFDLAILLPNSFYSAWIVWQAGIRERWGYRSDFRRVLLTESPSRPRGKVHQGAYYQHLVHELGLSNGPLTPHVLVPGRDRQSALALLQQVGWDSSMPLVGLAPGAAYGFAKQWPPNRFAAVARSLATQGVSCVLVGRTEDRDAGRQVIAAFEESHDTAHARGRLLNLIGRTDIRQLMGLMTYCATFVANDSGATHLAAALGLPVVAIFGPTDERISAPLAGRNLTGSHIVVSHRVFCRPCMLRECPIDHRCMKRIEPARVLEAVVERLAPAGAGLRGVGAVAQG
ncbi:MAG: lipopolysaccharide heptosyltransferase II [Vicinamibacterales bacterium]